MKSLFQRLTSYIFFLAIAISPFTSHAQQIVQNELPSYDILSNPSSIGVDPRLINVAISVPIEVPAGINRIQPNFAISYKSNNQNNLLGVGWQIDFDYIERSTKRGIPKYNNSDYFELIQSGAYQDLVYDSANGLYHAKIESSFMKIEFLSDRWLITDKGGTKYYFGATDDSRQADSGAPSNVFRWFLNRIEDVRTITLSCQPLIIDPTNDLNRKFREIELTKLFTKLEKDEKVLKVLKVLSRIKAYYFLKK